MKSIRKIILSIMCATLSACAVYGAGHRFEAVPGGFRLDGKDFQVKAAELHYPRIPKEYWRQRIGMAKALGMNTICLYVFWNYHEPQEGKFDFSGEKDIAGFCRMAQDEGMWVILRPGPYVCAEWEMGGLPWWLLKDGTELRRPDKRFLSAARNYLNRVGGQLADMQASRGGNIIMVQVENEYGSYGEDKEYVSAIRDMIKDAGFDDVLLFQCDWSSNFEKNGLEDLYWTLNFGTGSDPDKEFAPLRTARPEQGLMCSEFWSGWFDRWGLPHERRDSKEMVSGLGKMLSDNISFSLYMTHGGTSRGHWGGANDAPYTPMCSSYDYDAPIDEAGRPTEKYWLLRDMMSRHLSGGEHLPEVPDTMPIIALPSIELTGFASLFDNPGTHIRSDKALPMEDYDMGWGSILYRTHIPSAAHPGDTLQLRGVHDYAQIWIDGRKIGVIDRRHGDRPLILPEGAEGAQLDVLLDALGRVNFGTTINDRKGITRGVFLNGTELTGWDVYLYPAEPPAQDPDYKPAVGASGPGWYRARFNVDEPGDTFLDLSGRGKGLAYLNGHPLGRYWNIGPQQTIYVPGVWLNKGINELILFDSDGGEGKPVRGLTSPINDSLRLEFDSAAE